MLNILNEKRKEKRLDNHKTKIAKTEIWITCEGAIEGEGTSFRGFFWEMYGKRPEFHGHRGDELMEAYYA